MTKGFQVVFDCADPSALSAFWVEALGYTWADPPEGFASWGEWLLAGGVPEEEWDPGERPYNKIVDLEGRWPTIWFQRVPEPKTVKNRLHLDLDVSAGRSAPLDQRRREVDAEADRLTALGARRANVFEPEGHYFIVMQDPEGNEFCIR
jgi:hypothetical protein